MYTDLSNQGVTNVVNDTFLTYIIIHVCTSIPHVGDIGMVNKWPASLAIMGSLYIAIS